jgi:hypothetical protein
LLLTLHLRSWLSYLIWDQSLLTLRFFSPSSCLRALGMLQSGAMRARRGLSFCPHVRACRRQRKAGDFARAGPHSAA